MVSGGKLLQLSESVKSFPSSINTITQQVIRGAELQRPLQPPHRARLSGFARGYSDVLCVAGNSSCCHLKVLLGSRANSLCPSSCFRHPMAPAKQLYGDLSHVNALKSFNYKTGNFLLRGMVKRSWWRVGKYRSALQAALSSH